MSTEHRTKHALFGKGTCFLRKEDAHALPVVEEIVIFSFSFLDENLVNELKTGPLEVK
jgi:hypothetical protein